MEQSAPAYALGQSDTRPWGDWRVIDVGPGYVVKRITVRPEQSLSLQRHRHRDEHWLVVTGTAQIVRGGETFRLDGSHCTRGGASRHQPRSGRCGIYRGAARDVTVGR